MIGMTDELPFRDQMPKRLILHSIKQVGKAKSLHVLKHNSKWHYELTSGQHHARLYTVLKPYFSPQHYEPTPLAYAGSDKKRHERVLNSTTKLAKEKLGEVTARLNW